MSHIEGESIEDISIVVYFVYIENASSPLHVHKSAMKKKAVNVEIFTVCAERWKSGRSVNGMTSNNMGKPVLDVSLLPSVNTHCSTV